MIDSKGKLLDLDNSRLVLDLDDKEIFFYLFNRFDLSIDEVNLDNKEYVKSYPLEAEGPNGIGTFIYSLQLLNDNLFFLKSYKGSSLIDKNGHLIKRIDWENAINSSSLKLEQSVREKEVLSGTESLKVFGVHTPFKETGVYLNVLFVNDNAINSFDIDPENSYHDFLLRFDDNFMPPDVHISSDKNYILVSHEYSNEIIIFNHKGEFVKVVHYEPQLTPKRATNPGGSAITSRNEARKNYQHMLEQVRFESPVWDNVKNRYLRLSFKRIFTDNYEDESSFIPQSKDEKVFLSVFDTEFNLVAEIEIDELNDSRKKYFAKDGKLWVCQNFSDELGFIVIDL